MGPLLRARATILARHLLAPRAGDRLRGLLFIVLLAAFAFSARYLSARLFSALLATGDLVELIGGLLAVRLIALFLLLLWGMLFFGALITCLENFYFSEDIDFLASKPLPRVSYCLWKILATYLESAWVVYLVALPVFSGYALAAGAHTGFLALATSVLVLLTLPPVLVSALGVFALMRIVPLDRAKELLLGAGFLLSCGLVGLTRLLSPSRIFDPHLMTDFMGFLEKVRMPIHPWLPSNLAAEAILAAGGRHWEKFLPPIIALAVTAVLAFLLFLFLSPLLYRADRPVSRAARRPGLFTRPITLRPGARGTVLAWKELLTYLRDPTQISHLLLLAGVLVLHLANLAELPVTFDPRARSLLAFLNLGLTGFLLAAVAVRFVYPALSLEGRPFAFLLAAPIPLEQVFEIKWFSAAVPLLAAAEGLILVSNLLVGIPLPLSLVFAGATALFTLTITSAGAAAGVLAPRFDTPNVFEISSSSGGILFILVSLLYLLSSIVLLVPTTWAVTYSFDPWQGLLAPSSLSGLAGFSVLSLVLSAVSLRVGRGRIPAIAEAYPEIFA